MEQHGRHLVAVIGAGPAGLFAARELAAQGVHVCIFNRDIKPGGLAEYGIYPTKLKLKDGLRAQFHQILALDGVDYLGNLTIGVNADLNLNDLRKLGFQAILVTVGAQASRNLNIPGETLAGVYHSKDLVYHYNHLPPFSRLPFPVGKRAAIIGVGNVMMDIAHYLIEECKVDEVTAIARRGPAEVKFDHRELQYTVAHLDRASLRAEIERVTPLMLSLGQDPAALPALVDETLPKSTRYNATSVFRLRFLASPVRILGDENGHVSGLELEDNTLIREGETIKARPLGTRSFLPIDTLVYAIGDNVDELLGLPVSRGEFVKNFNPRFPVDATSYEVLDADGQVIPDVFVGGWARQSSYGLVGMARKDGVNAAQALLKYLSGQPEMETLPLEQVQRFIRGLNKPVITVRELAVLEKAEKARAEKLNLKEYKFETNQEMLESVGLLSSAGG